MNHSDNVSYPAFGRRSAVMWSGAVPIEVRDLQRTIAAARREKQRVTDDIAALPSHKVRFAFAEARPTLRVLNRTIREAQSRLAEIAGASPPAPIDGAGSNTNKAKTEDSDAQ